MGAAPPWRFGEGKGIDLLKAAASLRTSFRESSMGIIYRVVLTFLAIATVTKASAAESYIIVDNQTGYILGSKNRDEKRPVASLTKVATALVVLDWANLNNAELSTLATVPAGAVAEGVANPVGLQPGDQMSLRDLIYSALLASDNVAATTLADHAGRLLPNAQRLDPVGNFVSHMNALARSLGMKRTRFLNPTGFDHNTEAQPFSTAADMARLVRYAYDRSGFAFYVAQKSRQIHLIRGGVDTAYDVANTNELLGTDGIDGVKTGRTLAAGDCLILSADRPPESKRDGEKVLITPRRITVVLLRSPDRFGEGLALMRQGWGLYDSWAAEGRKVSRASAL